ncbi:MAG TPA: hypothetical protein VIH99_05135 [Bdellovibrionota bacterium]|jgi:hypothetical protein
MGLRSQKGNIVLVLMGGLFVLSLGAGLYYFLGPQAHETDNTAANARAAYDEAVAQMTKAMADGTAVGASIDRNPSFQCLYSGDGNCQGKGGLFLLFEGAQSNHPLSHLATDAGSDSLGSACKGYPSKDCPLRIETVWEPVCSGRCENVKDIRVTAKVLLAPIQGGEAPLEWRKEGTYTPGIRLSRGSECARGGGEWTGQECLTPAQVAERRVASQGRRDNSENLDNRGQGEVPAPVQQVIYECPQQIVVQGQYYPVQFLAPDRGQVSVPAMSCPQNGLTDVFVFQCAAKAQPDFPNEGSWIQVEAVMAPPCEGGNTLGNGNLPVRL